MRKHSVRKWLHAILDLLPIFLIPVFMIYSHRHTLTDVTTVDVQYKYQSNDVNSIDDLVEGNIYELDNFYFNTDIVHIGTFDINIYQFTYDDGDGFLNGFFDEINIYDYSSNMDNYFRILYKMDDDEIPDVYLYFTNANTYASFDIYDTSLYLEFSNVVFSIESGIDDFVDYFGLPHYTDYNVIESVQVDDTISSITDVFIDNFTHTVNTKFNFSSAFNFNDLWHWLDTNLFGAQNSQVMYAIYNIVVYEFLMDVLFIIYCLFMFIVDFAESCLDRPFNVTKRGK